MGRALGGLLQFDLGYLGHGNIVILDAENNQERWRSLIRRKMEREGLDPESTNRQIIYVRPSDIGLHDSRNWEANTADFVEALVANQARFVVGDSLGRIWAPEDVNSAVWVQRAYAPFRTACQSLGISGLMLTHTPKSSDGKGSGPQGPIGSAFQEGQADGQLMMAQTRINGQLGTRLTHRKSRRSFWIQQGSRIDIRFTRDFGYEPLDTWPHECPDYDTEEFDSEPSTVEKVEELLKGASGESITTVNIATQLDLKPRAVRNHLNKLEKKGRATKVDGGPNTSWRYAP